MKKEHENPLKRPICDICEDDFNSTKALLTHISDVHEGLKSFECHSCPKAYAQLGVLNRHISVKHEKRTYRCKHCDKSFKNLGSLSTHILAIHELKRFDCKFCGISYNRKASLGIHIKMKHPKKLQE